MNTMMRSVSAVSIGAAIPKEEKKRRVAAYCRVSTQSEQQETSYEAQCQFYTQKILQNQSWEMAGIYADAGITGTAKHKRKEFMRMIADCEAGKIDYILTKSISRFARNTLDCIAEVRHLRSLGVNIYFEENNLDTGLAYSEMFLTILAAFAQEESRSLSENVKWSVRNGFKKGKDRWVRIYGYEKNAQGTYQIVESEAEVVRMIFDAYEKGNSMSVIAKMLMDQAIPTPLGRKKWDTALVGSILENEKYAGDIVLQKFYTADHLSHQMVHNQGEVEMHYLENHHDPIVSKKSFERVKAIRNMNNAKKGNPQYPFAGKLRCPHCGQPLYQRKLNIQRGGSGWNCEVGDQSCHGFLIHSTLMTKAVLKAAHEKGYSEFEKVDYWWVDELIEDISFGMDAKTGESNNCLSVFWKDGTESVVTDVVNRKSQHPEYCAGLYWAWVSRVKNGTLGQQMRTKGSHVVDGVVVKEVRT